MQFFDARSTAAALPFPALIPALRERFAQGCEVPQRHVHEVVNPASKGPGNPASPRMTSLIMPAWMPGRCYGVKIVNIAPGNSARGLPRLHSSYLLFDALTGVPLAHLDGDQITTRRTVAASALAASFLARPDAAHLLVVGAGRVAQLLPEAYRAVRPIERVSVWARRPEAARQLAEQWQAEGLQAEAVTDLAATCAQADIVSCATLSTETLVHGVWLAPGSHLDLIGSFTTAMREVDDRAFMGARVFVDTEEALQKSGDLLGALSRGALSPGDVRGTLTTLCKGVTTARTSACDRTVFKSVGTALEDLTAAELVYTQAHPDPAR
jgi:ornithine cyclodeaminase/alanine dehydrogenase-like protein (mu-crystallin family)